MKDLINKVFEEKMQDGSIEKIVAQKIDKMIEDICDKQLRWDGAARKAMEEKLSPIILQAVERSDLSNMVTKITMVINTSLKGSEIEQYHDILQSVRTIFGVNDTVKALKEKGTVKLSEIFEKYKEYLQTVYDKDDFENYEMEDDGEGVTAAIECSLQVDHENDRGFSWYKPGYEVELHTEKSNEQKSGDIRFRLKWNYDSTKLHLSGNFQDMRLFDLRYAPEFILYLASIEREYVDVEIDVEQDDDVVYIDCRGI